MHKLMFQAGIIGMSERSNLIPVFNWCHECKQRQYITTGNATLLRLQNIFYHRYANTPESSPKNICHCGTKYERPALSLLLSRF